MMEDRDLLQPAEIVVEVTVVASGPGSVSGLAATDYQVAVDRALKGFVPGSDIIVRVPGGLGDDGMEMVIHGAPRFAQGSRAILFLKARSDGTYGVLHLMLGAFHLIPGPVGVELAVRNLSETWELDRSGELHRPRTLARDRGSFSRWIEDQAQDSNSVGEYLLPLRDEDLGSIASNFRILNHGRKIRWRNLEGSEGSEQEDPNTAHRHS